MKLLKKGQVGGLQGFILSIVTVAIVLAIGLIVLQELSTAARVGGLSTGAATAASNATDSIITKLATVPTWIGIIIIVALAFIVLSFFIGRRQ
ncbi:hypothetical protein LCGC14_2581390 [marine sediment metagenome]|uniref:MotA/TolQ/ExbB proton channel domain-containing protein n=1 Tax=marine sediment metagenome TaxID=412755 RepID=A0A0F9B283_9ZZZZ